VPNSARQRGRASRFAKPSRAAPSAAVNVTRREELTLSLHPSAHTIRPARGKANP
jgi:hypothetical protein